MLLAAFVAVLYSVTPMGMYFIQAQDAVLVIVHMCIVLAGATDMGVGAAWTVDASTLALQIYRWQAAVDPTQKQGTDIAKVVLTSLFLTSTTVRIFRVYAPGVIDRCFASSSDRQHAQ